MRIKSKQMILTLTTSIFVLLLAASLSPAEAGYFSDIELSVGNQIVTGTLDMEVRTNPVDTSVVDLELGETYTFDAFYKNTGTNAFEYSQEYAYVSGNSDLCTALQVEAVYYWYDIGGLLQSTTKYLGPLSALDINTAGGDPDLNNPNHNLYYPNLDYTLKEQWYRYTITLPDGTSPDLSEEQCVFSIDSHAWQQGKAYMTSGFRDVEGIGITVNSGIWSNDASLLHKSGSTGRTIMSNNAISCPMVNYYYKTSKQKSVSLEYRAFTKHPIALIRTNKIA